MKKIKFALALIALSALIIGSYPLSGLAGESDNPPHQKRLTGVLNINTATAEQFKRLRGLNEEIAQNIVKYREAHGPFKTIDALKNVEGFTEKLFSLNQRHLSISGGTTLRWVRVTPEKPSAPEKTEKEKTK